MPITVRYGQDPLLLEAAAQVGANQYGLQRQELADRRSQAIADQYAQQQMIRLQERELEQEARRMQEAFRQQQQQFGAQREDRQAQLEMQRRAQEIEANRDRRPASLIVDEARRAQFEQGLGQMDLTPEQRAEAMNLYRVGGRGAAFGALQQQGVVPAPAPVRVTREQTQAIAATTGFDPGVVAETIRATGGDVDEALSALNRRNRQIQDLQETLRRLGRELVEVNNEMVGEGKDIAMRELNNQIAAVRQQIAALRGGATPATVEPAPAPAAAPAAGASPAVDPDLQRLQQLGAQIDRLMARD